MVKQATVLLGLALGTIPAHAQQVAPGENCLPHAKLVANLRQQFGEMLVFQAMTSRGGLMEIFAGPIPSFTLVLTMPRMPSCVMAAGADWEARVAIAGRDL